MLQEKVINLLVMSRFNFRLLIITPFIIIPCLIFTAPDYVMIVLFNINDDDDDNC